MYFRIVLVVGCRQPKGLNEEGVVGECFWAPRAGVVTVVATRRPEAPASEVVMAGKHGVARGQANIALQQPSTAFCPRAVSAQPTITASHIGDYPAVTF